VSANYDHFRTVHAHLIGWTLVHKRRKIQP